MKWFLTLFMFLWWSPVPFFIGWGYFSLQPLAIVFLLVGIAGIWVTLATWLNITRVRADHVGLSCRVGPVWPGRNVWLPVDNISRLFTREEIEKSDEGETRSYPLYARAAGRDHKVVTLDTPEQAWWLEERIERHLGMADRPIAVIGLGR